MIELARQYGRYGYRRIAALLRHAGWMVNDKRIERLWRREGLNHPEFAETERKQGPSLVQRRHRHPVHDHAAPQSCLVVSFSTIRSRAHLCHAPRLQNVERDRGSSHVAGVSDDHKWWGGKLLRGLNVINVLTDLFINYVAACGKASVSGDNGLPEVVAEANDGVVIF